MAKKATVFICQNCGYQSSRWLGKCPDCEEWNSFSEERNITKSNKIIAPVKNTKKIPKKLSKIDPDKTKRIKTDIDEVDRVFGGGIVPDSLTLIGGAPGIGKSTIMLQIGSMLTKKGYTVLYVSAEESDGQIKMRAQRLNLPSDDMYLYTESSFEQILAGIKSIKPHFVIVDSIQTIYVDELKSTPGSVGQLREVTFQFMEHSKKGAFATILIGHITKDGAIAGPKILEHMVDTVLYFEGEKEGNLRILRSIKNRFGATNEVGIFEMRQKGLFEVKNPSIFFMSSDKGATPGSSLIPIMEGTRPFIMEIQALILQTNYQIPRRTIVGIDHNRISMLLAIMDKYLNLKFGMSDVYINVVGGVKIVETASDIGVMAALISNYITKAIPQNVAFIGEVGLNGEVRGVSYIENRIKELKKMGFNRIVLPEINYKSLPNYKDIEFFPVRRVTELFKLINSFNR